MRVSNRLLWLILIAVLAGCGGTPRASKTSGADEGSGDPNAGGGTPPQNTAPVANAGDDVTAAVNSQVVLDGSASFDADGDALIYRWTLVDIPAGSAARLARETTARPVFFADLAGRYVARLVVNDGQVDSVPDEVAIVVGEGGGGTGNNLPPIANAGPDISTTLGQPVQLDGSASTDPDGDALSYSWRRLIAPAGSTAQLSDPQSPAPTFVPDLAGSYVFRLVVNDGLQDSLRDDVLVRVEAPAPPPNEAPVANAGVDQNVVTGTTVQLDGSASQDPDQDALTFLWTLTVVPPGSTAVLSDPTVPNPTFVADLDGRYTVTLVVNDGTVDSAPDEVIIDAGPPNVPPVADAGQNQSVLEGDTVQLDGSASRDPDGGALIFLWELVSAPVGSTAVLSATDIVNPTFVADLPGDYLVRLVVNDGQADSAPAEVTITAIAGDAPPTANAGPDQQVEVGTLVTLDGTASSDPNGDPLTFQWTLTTGPGGSVAVLDGVTTANPTFTPDIPGTYVVSLLVSDGTNTASDSVMIVAVAAANTPPLANAGVDQTGVVGTVVVLDGGASSDPDGDPLSFAWSLTTVPAGSAAVLNNAASVTPSFTPDVAGTYEATLVVNDGTTDSAPDVVVITVN